MIAFLRDTQAKRLVYLLLVLTLCSVGCVNNLSDESSRATSTGWVMRFDGSGSTPVVADGLLFVGSADGAVYALDSKNGETKWRFQTGEGLSSSPQKPKQGESIAEMVEKFRREGPRRVDMTPAVENGTVFIGSGDQSFYAIDAATGKKKWSYLAGHGMASMNNTLRSVPAPVLKNGTVYFATRDRVHALDAATGERKWRLETSQDISDGPVLVENAVFVSASGPSRSHLFSVASDSGTTKWVTALDGGNVSAPVAAKGLVFVGTGSPFLSNLNRATLYAIDAGDGKIRWKLGADKMYGTSRLLIAHNTIYFSTDKNLVAAELESGRQLWSFNADEILSGLGADEQFLYIVTHKGSFARPDDTLHALELATGKEKWSEGLSAGAYLHMVHAGVVYAGRRYLHAVDAATGSTLWSFKEIGRGHSVGQIFGGRIFIVSPTVDYSGTNRVDQGHLYAIDAKTGKP